MICSKAACRCYYACTCCAAVAGAIITASGRARPTHATIFTTNNGTFI